MPKAMRELPEEEEAGSLGVINQKEAKDHINDLELIMASIEAMGEKLET